MIKILQTLFSSLEFSWNLLGIFHKWKPEEPHLMQACMASLKASNTVFEAAEELTSAFRMEAGLYSATLYDYLFI